MLHGLLMYVIEQNAKNWKCTLVGVAVRIEEVGSNIVKERDEYCFKVP